MGFRVLHHPVSFITSLNDPYFEHYRQYHVIHGREDVRNHRQLKADGIQPDIPAEVPTQ